MLAHLERYLAIEDILQLPTAHWEAPRDAPYPVRHDLIEADCVVLAFRALSPRDSDQPVHGISSAVGAKRRAVGLRRGSLGCRSNRRAWTGA